MSETITDSMSAPRTEKQNAKAPIKKIEKRSPQTALRRTDIQSNIVIPSIETKRNYKGTYIIIWICLLYTSRKEANLNKANV